MKLSIAFAVLIMPFLTTFNALSKEVIEQIEVSPAKEVPNDICFESAKKIAEFVYKTEFSEAVISEVKISNIVREEVDDYIIDSIDVELYQTINNEKQLLRTPSRLSFYVPNCTLISYSLPYAS